MPSSPLADPACFPSQPAKKELKLRSSDKWLKVKGLELPNYKNMCIHWFVKTGCCLFGWSEKQSIVALYAVGGAVKLWSSKDLAKKKSVKDTSTDVDLVDSRYLRCRE